MTGIENSQRRDIAEGRMVFRVPCPFGHGDEQGICNCSNAVLLRLAVFDNSRIGDDLTRRANILLGNKVISRIQVYTQPGTSNLVNMIANCPEEALRVVSR